MQIKLSQLFGVVLALVVLTCCKSPENLTQSQVQNDGENPTQKVVTLEKNFKIAVGQTLYVPAYSHIYHYNKKKIFDLAVTLSIRNTDLNKPIALASVDYYDSEGRLVRKYLERPIELAALSSTDFFVERADTSGGSGAKFIVEWVAQTKVSEPIVESIMIGTDFQQGISFVSPGKVIKSQSRAE